MKLFSNDQVKPGRVRIEQDGGGFECALDALAYEPGDDAETTMTVNPCDVQMAWMRWFASQGARPDRPRIRTSMARSQPRSGCVASPVARRSGIWTRSSA